MGIARDDFVSGSQAGRFSPVEALSAASALGWAGATSDYKLQQQLAQWHVMHVCLLC